ncbi:MAG: hypothetical protein UH211_11695 [Agathobacter sp.]|nr:hypothetical protein [Agathobacter sp.]
MKRKSLDNKGSTLVIVMIAMSIVAMLAVVALWISLLNFQMKTTDIEVKDNFYSAEAVLDQICVGLQKNVSDAYSGAYLDVMQNYSSLDENGRNNRFATNYIVSLRKQLRANDNDLLYDINTLKGYVDPALLASGATPSAVIECTSATDANGRLGLLNTYETGIVLKGIKVTFTDDKGYVSIIETDISLGIPDMNFISSANLPELFTYSIIATSGTELSGDSTNNVIVSGNVYSGSPYVVNHTKTDETTSVLIPNGKKLKLSNSTYFISEGDVQLGVSSLLEVPSGCQLWTKNIFLKSSSVNLLGDTYVADDMTLNGKGSKAILGSNNSGKYVGFGNSKQDAGESSAIIINGPDSTVDLSAVKELMLAGYAYVNTGAITGNGINNGNIQTGESISVKGNQIAYLVPAECLYTEGTGSDAKSKFGRNPLSYAEFKLVDGDSKYTEINADVITSKTGKPLSAYLNPADDISKAVSKIFVPSANGNSDDGYVYYYVNLPANKASDYYADFYGMDQEKLNLYTDFYTNYIKTNNDASASIYTVGNYSLYNEKNLSLMRGIVDGIDIDAKSAVMKNNYEALCKLLIKKREALTNLELSSTLYQNIIEESNLVAVTNGQSGLVKTFTANNSDGTKYDAVVANNDYIYDGSNSDIRLIVSSGNVTIKSDFTGTIIAQGKVEIVSNCRITSASEQVFKKLLGVAADETDPNSLMLYNVFKQGSSYLLNGIVGNNASSTTDSVIPYTEVITYQNWTKK